jgi:hypothetical protein
MTRQEAISCIAEVFIQTNEIDTWICLHKALCGLGCTDAEIREALGFNLLDPPPVALG